MYKTLYNQWVQLLCLPATHGCGYFDQKLHPLDRVDETIAALAKHYQYPM